MSYTYDGVLAEVEYRRSQLLAGADEARLARRLRGLARLGRRSRKGGRHSAARSGGSWEQVRDGTDTRAYDLAA